MKCPYCGSVTSRVVDSRPLDENHSIKRRRECERCLRRFNTFEKLETIPLFVVKKDNSREEFNRVKLQDGVILSCRKRPVSSEQINRLLDEIEYYISSNDMVEIQSTLLGELVLEKLRRLDEVAYVRFASVYRDFKDVDTFVEEISKLRNQSEEGDVSGQ